MDSEYFAKVDHYIASLVAPDDLALERTLESARDGGLPDIHVSPVQGKYIQFLARLIGAKRILEIGTLAGYSTIWLARALPEGGRLISLEASQHHADIARQNIQRAGLGDKVEIIVGAALDSLAAFDGDYREPYDMVFIDADKGNNARYLDWAIRLARPGALILADNVFLSGLVLDPPQDDASAGAVHDFNREMAADPRIDVAIQQQVGTKGHDGIALARVL